jgi:hypothetical protein
MPLLLQSLRQIFAIMARSSSRASGIFISGGINYLPIRISESPLRACYIRIAMKAFVFEKTARGKAGFDRPFQAREGKLPNEPISESQIADAERDSPHPNEPVFTLERVFPPTLEGALDEPAVP